MSEYVKCLFIDAMAFTGKLTTILAPAMTNIAMAGGKYLNDKDRLWVIHYLSDSKFLHRLPGPNLSIWKDDVDNATQILTN